MNPDRLGVCNFERRFLQVYHCQIFAMSEATDARVPRCQHNQHYNSSLEQIIRPPSGDHCAPPRSQRGAAA